MRVFEEIFQVVDKTIDEGRVNEVAPIIQAMALCRLVEVIEKLADRRGKTDKENIIKLIRQVL